MANNPLLIKQYAVVIYKDGTRSFATIPAAYHEDVKKYAAANYTLVIIDDAFARGFISEQEYQETLAYRVV